MQKLQGAYSCICLVNDVGLVAFRDPNGIRPLVLGRRNSPDGPEWCVASEDCAFGPIGFELVRDVQPGEMVIITEGGDLICSQCTRQQLTPCIFEYIYLARPDSVLNGISVYAPPPSCWSRCSVLLAPHAHAPSDIFVLVHAEYHCIQFRPCSNTVAVNHVRVCVLKLPGRAGTSSSCR